MVDTDLLSNLPTRQKKHRKTEADTPPEPQGKLSYQFCKTASDGKYSDGRGLRFIVRGNSKAWTFQYTFNGLRKEMGLGKFPKVSLADARDRVALRLHDIEREIDPLAVERAKREAAAAAKAATKTAKQVKHNTLREVVRQYHTEKVEKVRTERHAKAWLASIEKHIPAELLDKPITDAVNPVEWVNALTPLYIDVRVTGARVKQRLSRVFNYAVLRELAPTNPLNVVGDELKDVESSKKTTSLRALPYAAVPKLFKRLDSVPGSGARALQFAMLTVARTTEAIEMRWSELSDDGKVWTVPAERMKGGEPHTVYLSAQAQVLLVGQRGLHSDFVFPSPVKDKPISNMAMLMTLHRIGMQKQTTVHGVCRTSFSTWSNELGKARPDVIEACLAHKEKDKVRRAYNKAKFLKARQELLAAWASFIAPVTKAAKVIPMRQRKARQ